MKKLISILFILLFIGATAKIYAQALILQNTINTNIDYKLKHGKVIWVQTFDDPIDAASKCYFENYDGINLIVKLNPTDLTSLRIPIEHISCLYFNKFDHRFFVNKILILYACINGTVIIAGGLEIYGLAIITGGLGLVTFIKIVDKIGTKKRVYLPHYSLLTKQKK